MREPTLTERKRWWLLCCAATSMEKTMGACRLIQTHWNGEVDPMFEALSLAAHTYYARPFMKNSGVGKLDLGIVPVEHRGIHAWLMDFRCRTMAHTDSAGKKSDDKPLNTVIYCNQSGRHAFTTTLPAAPVGAYADVFVHCGVMLDVFKCRLISFHEDFGHLIPASDGEHLLSLEPSTPAFIEGYVMPAHSLLHYK